MNDNIEYVDYWRKNNPDINTPNSKITHHKFKDGIEEVSTVIYDEFGIQKWRIDFTDHGYPSEHSNPHLHERIFGPGYDDTKGKEVRYDFFNKQGITSNQIR